MSSFCDTNLAFIDRDDCIGASRADINNNFKNIREKLCEADDELQELNKRLKFLMPFTGIVNFWGDITLGGDNFDMTGLGIKNPITKQDLSAYALCNGNNGTPNLQDRFVVSSGSRYRQGTLGPVFNSTASLQFSSVQLTIPQLPIHDHMVIDLQHKHEIDDPEHNHDYHDVYNGDRWKGVKGVSFPFISLGGGGNQMATETDPSGGVSGRTDKTKADVELVNAKTNIDILHEGNNVPHENRPPYFALAYIMRVLL